MPRDRSHVREPAAPAIDDDARSRATMRLRWALLVVGLALYGLLGLVAAIVHS
jgi:hypothetical protein